MRRFLLLGREALVDFVEGLSSAAVAARAMKPDTAAGTSSFRSKLESERETM
jgi:hypothetical protein